MHFSKSWMEIHPRWRNDRILDYCKQNKIHVIRHLRRGMLSPGFDGMHAFSTHSVSYILDDQGFVDTRPEPLYPYNEAGFIADGTSSGQKSPLRSPSTQAEDECVLKETYEIVTGCTHYKKKR
ncbi:hypothetical protein Taro_054750 [Colocasia esculenta]|uniref:Uncharacterized protein n=1 Tax=Colocasia esculenta TaxID=4460 RepID=A0A843XQY7_COLES|nr:hypothetical protein [Colocasia esculenta]